MDSKHLLVTELMDPILEQSDAENCGAWCCRGS